MHSEDGKQPNKAKEIMMTHDEMISMVYSHKHGRPVQFKWKNAWNDAGENHQFNFSDYEYRIKPEPKLRPWKPEEVPVGAVVRGGWGVAVLTHLQTVCGQKFFCAPDGSDEGRMWRVKDSCLVDLQWKWPHEPETAWKPCGVEE